MSMKKYYITLPGGSPAGPLSLDALKVMARIGSLTAEHLYCEDGAPEWRPITELVIIHSATPVIPPVPGAVPRPHVPEKPQTYMVPSVILLALSVMAFYLSFIFAVVATVYACMADSSYNNNKLAECAHRGQVAKVWCIVAGVTMALQVLALLVLWIVVFLSAVAAI